jgi:uncharacterized glyoxalase superfamily protein PhnB
MKQARLFWFEVGNSLFNISIPDGTWRHKPETPGLKMKVYVVDVDSRFARAKVEGATILPEPADGFWGGRIYRELDYEVHQTEIAQRGRDLTADRWRRPRG